MRHLSLNSLSVIGQFETSADLEAALLGVFECLDIAHFAVTSRSATLWFDPVVESQPAFSDGTLLIAALKNVERDVRTKWFLYTRNRARVPEDDRINLTVTFGDDSKTLVGMTHWSPVCLGAHWISLGGTEAFQQSPLQVENVQTGAKLTIDNSHDELGFWKWWLRYEPSPKHGKVGYHAFGGKWVSPMPLDDVEAQRALDVSELNAGGRVANYSGRTIRFVLTHPNGNVFHGFEPTEPDE